MTQPKKSKGLEGSRNLHERELNIKVEQVEIEYNPNALKRTLDWDNLTMEPDKIMDYQLMIMSGLDRKAKEFVLQHHRLRDILEADSFFDGKVIKSMGTAEIMRRLINSERLEVDLLDSHGRKTFEKIDLKQLSVLVKLRRMNRFLGLQGYSDDELTQLFLSNKPITFKHSIERDGKKIQVDDDLRNYCSYDDMSDFDMDAYLDTLEENAWSFQELGSEENRTQYMNSHHIEAADKTLYTKIINRANPATGAGKMVWLPGCTTLCERSARTNLGKTNTSFLAAGHVHEIGWFDETAGITVKMSPYLLKEHRGNVDFRSFNNTNTRMRRAALILGQTELPVIKTEKDKTGKEIKYFYIGGDRQQGRVYGAMHETYDETSKLIRGEKFDNEEIDDKMMTDILIPFIANNPQDWLMCLATEAGNQLGYKESEAYRKGAEQWEKKFGFGIKIRCKNLETRKVELQTFTNFNDLIKYINSRIASGDVEGIDKSVTIPAFDGNDSKTIDRLMAEAEADTDEKEKDKKEFDASYLAGSKNVGILLKEVFGANTPLIVSEFEKGGLDAPVTIDKQTKTIRQLIGEVINNCFNEKDERKAKKFRQAAVRFGGVSLSGSALSEQIIEFLELIDVKAPVLKEGVVSAKILDDANRAKYRALVIDHSK